MFYIIFMCSVINLSILGINIVFYYDLFYGMIFIYELIVIKGSLIISVLLTRRHFTHIGTNIIHICLNIALYT